MLAWLLIAALPYALPHAHAQLDTIDRLLREPDLESAFWRARVDKACARVWRHSERVELAAALLKRPASFARQYALNRLNTANGAAPMVDILVAARPRQIRAVRRLLRAFDGLPPDCGRFEALWSGHTRILDRRDAFAASYLEAMTRQARTRDCLARQLLAGLRDRWSAPSERLAIVRALATLDHAPVRRFLQQALPTLADDAPVALVAAIADALWQRKDDSGARDLARRLVAPDPLRRDALAARLRRLTGQPIHTYADARFWLATLPPTHADRARAYRRAFRILSCRIGQNVTFGGSYPHVELVFRNSRSPRYITIVFAALSARGHVFRAERTFLGPRPGRHAIVAAYNKDWVETYGRPVACRVEIHYGPRKERILLTAVRGGARAKPGWWRTDDPTDRLGFYRCKQCTFNSPTLRRIKRNYWR